MRVLSPILMLPDKARPFRHHTIITATPFDVDADALGNLFFRLHTLATFKPRQIYIFPTSLPPGLA